jgi:Ricin-type beta-trefoil lectin domain
MIRRVGRHRRDRAILASAAGVILVGGSIAAALTLSTGGTAHADALGSCQVAAGANATCTATATIAYPQAIQLQILTVPAGLTASFTYTNTCVGQPPVTSNGYVTSGTSAIVEIPGAPSSCTVSATVVLQRTGELNVWIQGTVGSAPTSNGTTTGGQAATYHTVQGTASMCLDDAKNSSANRAKVVIWACSNRDPAQGWSASGGELKHNGLCLNAKGNGFKGAPVMLWSCNGAANEIWSRNSSSEYVLKAGGGKLCLTDPRNATKNGTQLIVTTCANASGQHWSKP